MNHILPTQPSKEDRRQILAPCLIRTIDPSAAHVWASLVWSWKIVFFLFNWILYSKQQRSLPLIQFAQLVELEQLIGKYFILSILHGFGEVG